MAPAGCPRPIGKVIESAINARFTVGLVGLVIALYSGIGWMGNVRSAIQAQWRPDFDEDQEVRQDSFIKNLLRNLGSLAGLGLAIVVSLALSAAGAWASTSVLKWLGLDDIAILKPVFTIVPILIAMAADVLIFMWVYTILPPRHQKGTRRALVRGSIMAAVGFEIFKFALTYLLPKVTSSATGQIFGSIIGLLFFFNITATMVLIVAAWISPPPMVARRSRTSIRRTGPRFRNRPWWCARRSRPPEGWPDCSASARSSAGAGPVGAGEWHR